MIDDPDAIRPNTNQQAGALQEIHKMWSIFSIGQHDPISLRAISPKGGKPKLKPINATFTAANYPDVGARKCAFESEALRLNALGYNVYVVMNAIRSDFGGPKSAHTAVRDTDIARRTVLLIDVDRARKADSPASIAELGDAMAVAMAVAKFLTGLGWPPPIRALSGNGFHLYWRLDDLPNDSATGRSIKLLLRALAERFDTSQACIDTSVANASRITKVPGSLARKGVASEGRPYRRAFLVDNHTLRSVTREELTRASSCAQSAKPATSTAPETRRLPSASREPDTPRRRACLTKMLEHISADCDYAPYRDVVWAILSTGWPDAPQVAEQWCMTAPGRFEPESFLQVIECYDPTRSDRPTIGTITHLAREGGWNG